METFLFESKGILKRLHLTWSFAGIVNIIWGVVLFVIPLVNGDIFETDAELGMMMLGGGAILFLMGLFTFINTQLHQASYLRIVEEGVMGIQPISIRGGFKVKQKFAVRFTDIRGVEIKPNTFGSMLCIHTENEVWSVVVEQDAEKAYQIICERSNIEAVSETEE